MFYRLVCVSFVGFLLLGFSSFTHAEDVKPFNFKEWPNSIGASWKEMDRVISRLDLMPQRNDANELKPHIRNFRIAVWSLQQETSRKLKRDEYKEIGKLLNRLATQVNNLALKLETEDKVDIEEEYDTIKTIIRVLKLKYPQQYLND